MKITLLKILPIPICVVSARGCSWEESKHIHTDRLSNTCMRTPREEDKILCQRLASRSRNCLSLLGIRQGAQVAIGRYAQCVQPLSTEIDNSRGSWEGRGLHTKQPCMFSERATGPGTVLLYTWFCTTRYPRQAALRYT